VEGSGVWATAFPEHKDTLLQGAFSSAYQAAVQVGGRMNWWYHFAGWHDQQMLDAVMCMLVFIIIWLAGLTMYVVRRFR
jgi:hypothetical protein